MIEFKCPECGKLNEVSDRKAGRLVRCTKCDEWIDVPDRDRKKKAAEKTRRVPKNILNRDHLTTVEFILAIVVFFFLPGCLGVGIGIFLYFLWNSDYPTKAYQILQAAVIVLVINILLGCCLGCLISYADQNPRRGPPRRFGQLWTSPALIARTT